MAFYPSRRGLNFCRFLGFGCRKNNDILGIYFVRNNCVFSDAPEPVQNKIPKKVTFLGNFLTYIFYYVSFSRLCFYTVLFGWSPTSGWLSEKTPFFRDAEKMTFFRVRQYGAFWLQRPHCGNRYHISPPTGLNLESPKISASKLANSKQQMVHSSHLLLKRWKWPMHVRILGRLWWGWNLGPWNDAIYDFRRSVRNVFFGLKKCCFFGPRLSDDGPKKSWLSGWLAIWLAGCLSSWLAIWLARWLAGYLAIGFVAGWLFGY